MIILEILFLCSMTELISQPEAFPKYFCMFDMIVE